MLDVAQAERFKEVIEMKFSKDPVEGWNRLTPAKRRRLLSSAYKHYLRASVFPWLLCAHIIFVAGLIYLVVWSLATHYEYSLAVLLVIVGLLCGISGAIQAYALAQIVRLRYRPYYRQEIEESD